MQYASDLSLALYDQLRTPIRQMSLSKALQMTCGTAATVISMIELHVPLFARKETRSFEVVKAMLQAASKVLWITGDFVKQPGFAMFSGAARAIMLEQPGTRIFSLGLTDSAMSPDILVSDIERILYQADHALRPDLEFRRVGNVLQVSRFVEDFEPNERFRRDVVGHTVAQEIGTAGMHKLAIGNPGQFNSIHWLPLHFAESRCGQDDIEIIVKTWSLNAKVCTQLTILPPRNSANAC